MFYQSTSALLKIRLKSCQHENGHCYGIWSNVLKIKCGVEKRPLRMH